MQLAPAAPVQTANASPLRPPCTPFVFVNREQKKYDKLIGNIAYLEARRPNRFSKEDPIEMEAAAERVKAKAIWDKAKGEFDEGLRL